MFLFLKFYLSFRSFLDFEADKFIEKNPEVAVYITERKGQSPRLVANYCEYDFFSHLIIGWSLNFIL